jgi:hypothetical protein
LSSKVVKENQVLHKGDRIIDNDDESATLADANIFAGDQIIVRDSEIHENRDIAGKLFDSAIMVMQSLYFYSHRDYEYCTCNLLYPPQVITFDSLSQK